MKHIRNKFSHAATDYYFNGSFSDLKKLTDQKSSVLITDENIQNAHKNLFKGWNTIVLKPGEEFKVQETVDAVIEHLITLGADRKFTVVGVGGGVITDITGYIASIYMRGIRAAFVPTSLLAMVDAAIGGKNGIDVGVYKNMVGTIRQPAFLLFDHALLSSLPVTQWQNGFAEVIKHACIRDARMFSSLEKNSIDIFRKDKKLLDELIYKNAMLKSNIVKKDEFEEGDRKHLNFGHTLGHALENQYELSHGQAISIGMTYACHISEKLAGFRQTDRVIALLEKYGLPSYASFNTQKVFEVLKMDKKKYKNEISYILLEKIGKAVTKNISFAQLERIIQSM